MRVTRLYVVAQPLRAILMQQCSGRAASQHWRHTFATAAGGSSGGAPSVMRAPISRHHWFAALAACLGAGVGLQLQAHSDAGAAQCKADETVVVQEGKPTPPVTAAAASSQLPRTKTRVVVLGSGWGAVSFLKSLDPATFAKDGQYELTVISPRNYFLYTPLLPSAVAGSVEERSIVEPVRRLLRGQGNYYQAECVGIDASRRVLRCAVDECQACQAEGKDEHPHGADGRDVFEVPYDVLLLGVGSVNNTFGIKGVREQCFFLKSIEDAHRLRVQISKAIEHAGLPNLSKEERSRHLNFVVVGGGPTGVELAAELLDLVQEDVSRLFPHLKNDIRITVVDTMDHLLGAFDRQLSEYTRSHLMREGIRVELGTMVSCVSPGVLAVKRGGVEGTIPFGTCVWATGVAMHPLVRSLKEQLPPSIQFSRTGVVVDSYLRVKGTNGTVFALGDAAVTNQDKAVDHAEGLFSMADTNQDQRLSKEEVLALLKKMGELASLLEEGVLEKAARGVWGFSRQEGRYTRHIERLKHGLTFEEFQELLADMDTLMRALPATAQVASQEGKYLARLFSDHTISPTPHSPAAPAPATTATTVAAASSGASAPSIDEEEKGIDTDVRVPLPDGVDAFKYHHLGMFAYVGADKAVFNLPGTFPFSTLKGWLVGTTWRSFEAWKQVSARNRWMVHADWLRTKIFGRNISEA